MRTRFSTSYLVLVGFALSCTPCLRADGLAPASAIAVRDFALVGKSMQQVLLELPPPEAVYLAGEDAELPRPKETDGVVFRYELPVELAGVRHADVYLLFDPDEYEVESVTLQLAERLALDTVVTALGPVHRRERRHVATDDFDIWITDEVDPEGQAEVVIFPELGLLVRQIDGFSTTTITFERSFK